MTDQAEPEVAVTPSDEVDSESWFYSIVLYAVVAAAAAMAATFGILAMYAVAVLLVLGAIPYTLIATTAIIVKRKAARKSIAHSDAEPINTAAARFAVLSQRLSLFNAGALGALGILTALTLVDISPLGIDGTYLPSLIAAFSVAEIAVNARWIYVPATVHGEEYAVRTRTHAWRLIIVNRWLGWVVWFTGAGAAGYLLATQGPQLIHM